MHHGGERIYFSWMIFKKLLAFALVVVCSCASTKDISNETVVLMHHGDVITFAVEVFEYGIEAARLGAPQIPNQVSFVIALSPSESPVQLEATLQSTDGTASMPFPLLRIQSGEMQSYRYTGAITAISGSLGLSSAVATQLLGNNAVFLVIRNAGPAFTIGGLPYTISQDMNVSLTGNQLSVGALISGVVLQTAARPIQPERIP